jgi:secreted Zn-dependent insulinase-like peptidase
VKLGTGDIFWYMKDDKFERPKAFIKAKVYTSDCNLGKNPRGMVFAEVWKVVLEEYAREFCYNASMAELNVDVTIRRHGFEVSFNGYNDSMKAFVSGFFKKMKTLSKAEGLEQIFNTAKEQLLQEWKNYYVTPVFR